MGNNKWQRKASSSMFSMFNMFKQTTSRRSSSCDYDMGWDDAVNVRRARASDDDRGRWVAEPDIDRKATAFIARFYESRVSDAEHNTVAPVYN
ncbi:hypothetical protein MKW98_003444 [Papaver atlanticum]|uniref:Uncharacterized protein n=1 Tax=Papaver atlanticum TaxID=357466 RepID=A0AAD4TCP9_9MAGN|nr:uncharacterized protein LOC113332624 [Papaver somniferum]KAI3839245.1 hypothetical protein MKX03_032875 [Papaver bracteatum]KAI3946881.1 hypothetical protein MKW98_003444 [Papaver atlanticum]KAI3973511.1 hypothetical protein MKW92_005562 [Papaver armeniacum]KAI3993290.1 hypothetical protein MKX01_010033 [Papaver californicum]RZC88168.1 hypothetical protein C5167_015972 [Papaver somniferum]